MAQPLAQNPVDLLLGPDNDLVIDTDLQLVYGIAGIAQLCMIAVQMFAGEWFLDLDLGIPYWDQIFGQDPEVAKLAARVGFRNALLGIDGVLEILVLDVSFSDALTRTLTVTWQVRTSLGDTVLDTLSVQARSV